MTITNVIAGTGLSGGGTAGAVTLNARIPFSLTSTTSSAALRGYNTYNGSLFGSKGIGVYGNASGDWGIGVYGYTASTIGGKAIYGYANGTGIAVSAVSKDGIGVQASTGKSDAHAGYFSSTVGVGLSGATLYTMANNSSGQGIALWAINDNTASTDATVVISNDGSGALLKGFGGDGGEEEFRIDNNGSLHIFDPSISDDALYFSANSAGLTLGSGSLTTTGDDGDLYVLNSDGRTGAQIDGYSASLSLGYGSSTSTGNDGDLYVRDNTGSTSITLDGQSGRVTAKVVRITGGSDLAEHFDVDKHLNPEPGMLVSIDPVNPGKLLVSSEPYDRKVAGIISGAGGINTGMMMGQQGSIASGSLPVALTGRVYCMADSSQGSIEPGDLLTTSNIPGHAMKVTDYSKASGAIIGKAMTPMDEKTGLVLVLVSLQ